MNVALPATFDVLSLFSGGGGLDLGIRLAVPQSRVVGYVEREAYAASVLVARMEAADLDPAPVWDDVATFDGRPWLGIVDCVAGGFPCQDISNAGNRVGIEGERSGLWSHFARIIREVRPRYVFVENVAALVVRGLDVVLGDLASLGFDAEWIVLGADDVGAPHQRDRLFLLAHAAGEREREPHHAPGAVARERARLDTRGRGGNVAYADIVRCKSERRDLLRNGLAPPGHNVDGRSGAPADMADAECEMRRGQSDAQERSEERGTSPDRRGSQLAAAPFPPGPDDREGWEAYLREWPGTEPAIRRGADGLAHRMERLRLLGNGVVPQQAAAAFGLLWERLHE